MRLLASSNVCCCASVRIFSSDACLRPTLSVVKFSGSFEHHHTQTIARITPCYGTSHNCFVSGDGKERPGGGNGLSRGLSTRSGILTINYTNVGSIFPKRLSSIISHDREWSILNGCSESGSPAGISPNGGSLTVLDGFYKGRLPCLQWNSRGLVIRCSITIPEPNEHSPLETPTAENGTQILTDSYVVNNAENTKREPIKAAFLDVDGTITRTNVVMAYLCIRMAELSFLKKILWVPWFLLSCIVYMIVDHFHRPTFNRIFYSSYKGRPTDCKAAMASLVFEKYYKPRIMAGAAEQILELKQLGYRIVLVTGALDFQIAPLAQELGADFVYAAKLVEENGRFTGELHGMASSNSEKAERIWDYATRHSVSLRDSLAFGDSIADIPMLEVVGRPYAVNPDARLQSVALKRGWAILNWKVNTKKVAAASV
ncbi:unnamed protein product [Calypogeia fissa]